LSKGVPRLDFMAPVHLGVLDRAQGLDPTAALNRGDSAAKKMMSQDKHAPVPAFYHLLAEYARGNGAKHMGDLKKAIGTYHQPGFLSDVRQQFSLLPKDTPGLQGALRKLPDLWGVN
jgi:hypothetical protein